MRITYYEQIKRSSLHFKKVKAISYYKILPNYVFKYYSFTFI